MSRRPFPLLFLAPLLLFGCENADLTAGSNGKSAEKTGTAQSGNPFEAGLNYYLGEKYEQAIAEFDQVIQSDPRRVEAYVNRGLAKAALERFEDAISDFDRAIELAPEDADAYLNRGNALYGLDEIDRAIGDYNRAIELDSKDADACRNRGLAWHDKGELDAAIRDYSDAIRLNRYDVDAYQYRAEAWDEKGNEIRSVADASVARYTEALQDAPDDVDLYVKRGLTLHEIGEYEFAIEDFTLALEADPQSAMALLARGESRMIIGQPDKAVEDFDRVIESNPDYAPAFGRRGIAREARQQWDLALDDYRQAVQLDPEDADTWTSLAWLLVTVPDEKFRNTVEGVRCAKQACEQTKWQDWYTISIYAHTLAENKQIPEAVEQFEQAMRLAPEEERGTLETTKKALAANTR